MWRKKILQTKKKHTQQKLILSRVILNGFDCIWEKRWAYEIHAAIRFRFATGATDKMHTHAFAKLPKTLILIAECLGIWIGCFDFRPKYFVATVLFAQIARSWMFCGRIYDCMTIKYCLVINFTGRKICIQFPIRQW